MGHQDWRAWSQSPLYVEEHSLFTLQPYTRELYVQYRCLRNSSKGFSTFTKEIGFLIIPPCMRK